MSIPENKKSRSLEYLKSRRIDPQDTFNEVVTHMRAQGRKGEAIDGCAYRAWLQGRKLKCAAGCLIPDHLYDKKIEGHSVHELKDFIQGDHFLGHDRRLVSDLQCVHDDTDVDQWEQQFAMLAKQRSLFLPKKESTDAKD